MRKSTIGKVSAFALGFLLIAGIAFAATEHSTITKSLALARVLYFTQFTNAAEFKKKTISKEILQVWKLKTTELILQLNSQLNEAEIRNAIELDEAEFRKSNELNFSVYLQSSALFAMAAIADDSCAIEKVAENLEPILPISAQAFRSYVNTIRAPSCGALAKSMTAEASDVGRFSISQTLSDDIKQHLNLLFLLQKKQNM